METTVLKEEAGDTETTWTIKFANNSQKLAFFIRPQIVENGEEILPAFWSASYFSLAPGESIIVSVSAPSAQLKNNRRELQVSGWNMEVQQILLK